MSLTHPQFKPGDWVVYSKRKTSECPGPRARIQSAASKGDYYNYVVDKYWIIRGVQADGSLELLTRRGKRHVLSSTDPCLRKAHWWERFLHSGRYRSITEQLG